jgi:branched-chain amino acid transport system permease protein
MKIVTLALALLVLLFPWAVDNPFLLIMAQTACIFYVAVLGLNLVMGMGGQVSIGHAALMGTGAYTSALLTTRFGVPFPIDLLVAGALSGTMGILLGIPSLRLSGAYLAMATIGFNLVWQKLAINWTSFTGGADGIPGIPFPNLGPVAMDVHLYWYPVLATVLVLLWMARNFATSRYGRALLALKHDEAMAAAMGVNIFKAKLLTFAMSAVYAGMAGALLARLNHHVSPWAFGLDTSLELTLMAVLAGPTSLYWPLATTLFITALPHVPIVQQLQDYRLLAYGAILLASVTVFPQGLQGLVRARTGSGLGGREAEPNIVPAQLVATGLVKSFGGIRALASVDLELRPSTITALIGPNGSGKTTLVNLLTGLLRADDGKIQLGERNIIGMPPHRRAEMGILRTFQTPRLISELSVLDNIMLGCHARMRAPAWSIFLGTKRSQFEEVQARAMALGAAREVGLSVDRLPHGIETLSQAEVRLLELARAVAGQPSILLLDEPASGLATDEATRMAHLLLSWRDQGMAILLIEHRMEMVMRTCDTVVVLHEGRVIAEGSPAQIGQSPKVVAAYMGEE